MKNKISDLRNHLFAQMERLNNEELNSEELAKEIQRATAMSELGKVIVDSAKTQVLAAKVLGKKSATIKGITEETEEFVIEDPKQLERPKAEYSNKGHLNLMKEHGQLNDAA